MSQPTTDAPPHARPLFLDPPLLIVYSITLVAMQGMAAVAPALPAVSRAYNVSAHEAAWLVAAFTLPGIFLAPVTGVLADRFGRKAVVVPCLLLFAAAGSACSLQWQFEQLVALRFLQGIGGASLQTLGVTLLGDIYSGNRRATVMGFSGGFTSIAAAGYPLVGGSIALLGWHYVFLLPLLGIPVALLVAFGLNVQKPDHAEGLGTYLRNMAATASRPETLVLFAGSFFTFMVLYGAFVTYLPFYLETEYGLSSAGYGTVLAANAVGGAAGSIWLGALTRIVSRRTILLASFAAMALGVLGLGLPVGMAAVYAFSAIAGAAMGIALSNIQVLLTETSPLAQRGGIIAWNGTMFRLGQTAGPAVMGVALALSGMTAVFVVSAVLCALALPLIAFAVRKHGA